MKFQSRFCFVAVLAAISCCGSAINSSAQGAKKAPGDLKFHSLRFYEHGAGDLNPSSSAVEGEGAVEKFASHFPISKTRFISGRIVFENLQQGQKEVTHEITMGLYTSDNQLVSANKKQMVVPAEWKFAWASQSYGWAVAGRWGAGTYRLRVWLGKDKVGESAFYMDDDGIELPKNVAGLTLGELEFYEGGGFFRPGPAERAGATFARSKARKIYWVVRGINKLHLVRAQRPNVVGYFYRPDGTLLGEVANRFLIPPEVKEAVLVEGLGWAVSGNWQPGEYRFELEQDHRVVMEKSFEITDPFLKPRVRPQVIHYGIIAAGVFAGTEAAPEDEIGRKYPSEMLAGETDTLWAELVVVNNPNHEKAHAHKLSWQCYAPDGSMLSEKASDFVIRSEWKTARQRVSFEPGETGAWEPGAYKVRIVIDGKLARVVRFELNE